MNTRIKHHPENARFEIHIEGLVGYIEYQKSAGIIDYTHTVVPRALGGRGLGTELVKYALAYARVEHLKVIPTCSFVAALMDKHVVYHDLRGKKMHIKDSERLTFALMGPEDIDLLFELDQDVEVMRYINGGKITSMQDVREVFLPRMAEYTDAGKGWGLWKTTIKATDTFIGWILVRPMDFFNQQPQWKNWELGWRFNRAAWGFGYGTEAAQHIMTELAASQDVDTFSAIAMPGNQASINIMQKLGMKYLKTDLNKDPLGDEEVVYYELNLKS